MKEEETWRRTWNRKWNRKWRKCGEGSGEGSGRRVVVVVKRSFVCCPVLCVIYTDA